MLGLVDSTLREGEQTAGVYLTLPQKLRILRRVACVGIEEIEVGVASADPELQALLAEGRAQDTRPRLALWCRCLPSDLEVAAALQPDVLSLSLPVSDLHLSARLGWTRPRALRVLADMGRGARALRPWVVSLGLEDATRADPGFLREVLEAAEGAGVTRVRLADTVGRATPAEVAALVALALAARAPSGAGPSNGPLPSRVLEVGVHTHNDFGMATANAVAALQAGADWADVTVLGLGERAGCARLEEVVGYLSLGAQEPRYHPDRLAELCREVAAAAGTAIHPHHPLVGSRVFDCESGLHLDGLAKAPATYEPYPPEHLGRARTARLGKKVGRGAVAAWLAVMGRTPSRSSVARLTQRIRDESSRRSRALSDAELLRLLEDET
ncbi:MAG TPA: hypothetical protein VGN26_14260 [Armatimonadota bacterium]|jgi:homocitrate synthase NifV